MDLIMYIRVGSRPATDGGQQWPDTDQHSASNHIIVDHDLGAFRVIALLDGLGKLVEKTAAHLIVDQLERGGMLHDGRWPFWVQKAVVCGCSGNSHQPHPTGVETRGGSGEPLYKPSELSVCFGGYNYSTADHSPSPITW